MDIPSTSIGDGPDKDSESSGSMREKLSILIVDNDVLVCRVHETLLSQVKVAKEVQTEIATDGKEALDLHLSGSSYDIILMDMELPIMDGPEVTKKLRAMGVQSMIVGVTSRESEVDRDAFMVAGLDECLKKPLSAVKIKFLVESLEKKM